MTTRLSYDPATRHYLQRRCAEGKTKTEAIRCLKRYVARELYTYLPITRHWLDSTLEHQSVRTSDGKRASQLASRAESCGRCGPSNMATRDRIL